MLAAFLDGDEGADYFPLFCAQPRTANNLCLGGVSGGKKYCHQKLITIKISGEKAAKEKIVQGNMEKRHQTNVQQWKPT